MDSTVIQEIANQLGMAVDQAGQFVTEHLPAFAGLKVIQNVVPLVIVWALFFVLLIAALIALTIAVKARNKDNEDGDKMWSNRDLDDYASFWIYAFVGAFAVVALIIAAITTGCVVPDIIGWSNYPEAMLLDMALKSVG